MHLRNVVCTCAFACAVLTPAAAAANPVNAEALRPKAAQEGFSGGADLSFAMRSGNVNLLNVAGGGIVQYQVHRPRSDWEDIPDDQPPLIAHTAFIIGNYRFAQRVDDPIVNQGFLHARWTAMWFPRLGTEVFGQYGFNEFLLLQARALGGVGVRLDMIQTPDIKIWGGTGYMLEYNRITVAEGASDAPEDLQNRWTNYISARATVFEGRLLLQNTLYVQPRLTDFEDLRLLEVFEALAPIHERFAIGVDFSLLYDGRPPTGVEATDITLSTTLKFSF